MATVQRKFQGNNMISWGSTRVVATQQGTPGHMATSSSQTALEDPKLRCIHDDEVLGCGRTKRWEIISWGISEDVSWCHRTYISTVLPPRSCNVYPYTKNISYLLCISIMQRIVSQYFLMGWNAWTKVHIRIDITCIINHRLVFIPRIPHQSMLILDTNYRKLFLHWRSIHKHCLPKKSVQNNWKSQQPLPHGMPLLNNPWMYCISCMSSSHSLQQLLTKLPQP